MFAYRLRDVRLSKGWKQEDLAAEMNQIGHPIGRVTIAKIEAGAHGVGGEVWHEPLQASQTSPRPVSLDEAFAFAVALGVPVTSLMLPMTREDDVRLSPEVSANTENAHAWARGQSPLEREDPTFYRTHTFVRRAKSLDEIEQLGIPVLREDNAVAWRPTRLQPGDRPGTTS